MCLYVCSVYVVFDSLVCMGSCFVVNSRTMKLDDERTEYSLLLTMKAGLLNQIIAGWVGRVGMPSKSF